MAAYPSRAYQIDPGIRLAVHASVTEINELDLESIRNGYIYAAVGTVCASAAGVYVAVQEMADLPTSEDPGGLIFAASAATLGALGKLWFRYQDSVQQ